MKTKSEKNRGEKLRKMFRKCMCMRYQIKGPKRRRWLADLPYLSEMIAEGTIDLHAYDPTSITYLLNQRSVL